MDIESKKTPFIKSSEEWISMFLGLAIVLVVFFLLLNYFQKRKSGNVEVPGVSTVAEVTNVAEKNISVGKIDLVTTKTPIPTKVVTVVKNETIATLDKTEVEYTVLKGDNLWKIAEAKLGSGYRWVEIQQLNALKNPSELLIGQKLILPTNEKGVALVKPETIKAISGNEYVVEKNDSLSKIALRAYGDSFAWTRIWEANKQLIKKPSVIHKGWKLIIPR